ncbi:VOC family protein [Streptomyces inhibens]|uniref:VOC family protein n=1 Tax=Streptomyces inhibens TaxID=2293571 RepID=UPI00367EDCC6
MRAHLIVIYTERLEACRDFYAGLGLAFERERHGDGPGHYAAVLDDDVVLELYPVSPGRPATGSLRLGLCVEDASRPAGRQVLTDPDGRAVDLLVR